MIFYTLKGPRFELEIHDHEIKLVKRSWLNFLKKKPNITTWNIQGLSQFEISVPQFILWGKLEWSTFDGHKGSFRFSTDAAMVKKIETYLQKRILKNHQKQNKADIKSAA